jgi:4-hydroxybenzoate polyprenyltransferase
MYKKLQLYIQLTRLNRPIGVYLLLWPTLWALWIAAEGVPEGKILVIFVLGVIFMRSAGCAINDYADRDIDGHVERTKLRPLVTGELQAKEALMVFVVLALASFLLVLQLNTTTILLSFGAVLLAASYPFMKRFHSLPQLHLGLAFSWAVPMAFTAITEQAPPLVAWLLLLATFMWTVAYDTMYALSDKQDDLKIGVKSTAILFGRYVRPMTAFFQVLTLLLLVFVGLLAKLGFIYYLALLVGAGLMLYQQYLLKEEIPSKGLQAFLHNNWFGLTIFIGILLHYALF